MGLSPLFLSTVASLLIAVSIAGKVGCLGLITKGLEAVTYCSLCLPHQLADCGVQDLAHCYY